MYKFTTNEKHFSNGTNVYIIKKTKHFAFEINYVTCVENNYKKYLVFFFINIHRSKLNTIIYNSDRIW